MWSRRRGDHDLDRRLRRLRPEAPPELVDRLVGRVEGAEHRSRRAWSRLAFAAALSVFVLGTFASFGGLSYAASGATQTYQSVKKVVVTHKVTVRHSSASDQYGPKPSKVTPSKPAKPKPHGAVAAAVSPAQSGTLPFTGLSLLGTFVVSLALIGLGVALRRRERRS